MPGKEQTSVEEKEERKKIDLKIEVKDFGPISNGEITLKPLTVFIGPNNSGKSYAAMLIHSIFRAYADIQPALNYSTMLLRPEVKALFRSMDISPFRKVIESISSLGKGMAVKISTKHMAPVYQAALDFLYQTKLSSKIALSFACSLDGLVRIGKTLFGLGIVHKSFSVHLKCQKGKMKIEGSKGPDLKLDRNTEFQATMDSEQFAWQLMYLMLDICDRLLRNIVTRCYYLPAGRCGISQVYRMLAANIVRQATNVGVEKAQVQQLSGVVSDFVSSLIEVLPAGKGPFYQLARDFEEKLIRGEIVTPTPSEHLYPEIKYKFQDTEIPLHRSSSTVSELAPLFFYLKHVIGPNSILIIEEPEAHLHPANQRILARLLVRLVREGLNLILTTHSEYLLEQLRNFVLLSKVKPEKRVEKYQYEEEDYLSPDEFAAYVFHHDKESDGYKIDQVQMSEDGEISQDEFVNIIDALYEETIKLRIDLSDET